MDDRITLDDRMDAIVGAVDRQALGSMTDMLMARDPAEHSTIGFAREAAITWLAYGFDATSAAAWLDAGCDVPSRTTELRAAGVTPDRAAKPDGVRCRDELRGTTMGWCYCHGYATIDEVWAGKRIDNMRRRAIAQRAKYCGLVNVPIVRVAREETSDNIHDAYVPIAPNDFRGWIVIRDRDTGHMCRVETCDGLDDVGHRFRAAVTESQERESLTAEIQQIADTPRSEIPKPDRV
jgi:hypothetical protein